MFQVDQADPFEHISFSKGIPTKLPHLFGASFSASNTDTHQLEAHKGNMCANI